MSLLNTTAVINAFQVIPMPSCEVVMTLSIDGPAVNITTHSFTTHPDDETQVAEITITELDQLIRSLQLVRDVLDPA